MIRPLLVVALVGCGSAKAPVAAPAKPLAEVDGAHGKLRVDDGGSGGTPVIFVHGLGGDRHVWKEALAHVRASRRAIALDLHGFGESEGTATAPYTIESFGDDVVRVADAAKADKVILVGHSLGGHVVSEVAAKHPQRVAGVVLVDPSSDFSVMQGDARKQMETTFVEKPEAVFGMMLQGSAPGVSEAVTATLRTTKPDVFKAAAVALFAFDPKPNAAAYKGPRVSLISPMMEAFPAALHKVVPGIETHVMAGTSHWPQLDKPAEFNAHLDAFLAKLP